MGLLTYAYNADFDYVTQMRYNKDKDLVFVKKHSGLWREMETVHEVHHMEQMVPAPVSAMRNMSAMDKNGILTVHDMAERSYFKFYKEDKYWNPELKDEFLAETMGLWGNTHADKYTGRIFQTRGAVPVEHEAQMMKVDEELE